MAVSMKRGSGPREKKPRMDIGMTKNTVATGDGVSTQKGDSLGLGSTGTGPDIGKGVSAKKGMVKNQVSGGKATPVQKGAKAGAPESTPNDKAPTPEQRVSKAGKAGEGKNRFDLYAGARK